MEEKGEGVETIWHIDGFPLGSLLSNNCDGWNDKNVNGMQWFILQTNSYIKSGIQVIYN